MKAWGKDQKIEGTNIRFMGDPAAELTKKLAMEMTHPGPASVGIIGRCKRHAMIVDDGEVKWFAISEDDDDPAGDGKLLQARCYRPDLSTRVVLGLVLVFSTPLFELLTHIYYFLHYSPIDDPEDTCAPAVLEALKSL